MKLHVIRPMRWINQVCAISRCRTLIDSASYATCACLFSLLLATGCAQEGRSADGAGGLSESQVPVQATGQERKGDEAPYPASNPTGPAPEPSSPHRFASDLSQLVPSHLIVHSEHRGDLDGDGDEDLLLVLTMQGGPELSFEPRTLMVLRQNPQGKLEKAVQNPSAILCQSCGGMMGEPLQGIKISAGEFSLRFEGGSRELWSREYRFVYSVQAQTWLLSEFESGALDKATEESGSNRLTPKDFGSIPIERFNPAELSGDSLS